MIIRPFETADLPSVANLYEKLMRSGNDSAPAGLTQALGKLFVDSPVRSAEIPSLVGEVDGRVVGFQGVQLRPFELEGSSGRLAVLGPVFVVPELRSRAAGALLIRAAMRGPQDLTVSDGAPEASRALWEQLGGMLAVPQTLEWNVVLRPALLAVRSVARGRKGPGQVLGSGVAPLALAADAIIAPRWNRHIIRPAAPVPEAVPLAPARFAELSALIDPGVRLRMVHPPDLADWIFDQLRSYSCRGEVVARELRDGRGPIGHYIAYASPDGIFRLMHSCSSPRNLPSVFAALVDEASRRRMLAVRGRLEGRLASVLAPYRVRFSFGNRVLVHARERSLRDAVLSLDNSISRIDGEWLMAIRDQPYTALR